MRRSHPVLVLLIAPLVASSGCGQSSNTVWVTGKIVKGGAKYVPPAGQLVSVTLVALEVKDPAGKTSQEHEVFWTEVDQAEGTFSVPGKEGRGIPPGKYRVAVTQKMTREAFDAAYPKPKKGITRETDTLNDQFGVGTSPVTFEIPKSTDLTVDLDQPGAPPQKPDAPGRKASARGGSRDD